MSTLSAIDLVKRYGKRTVVRNLTIQVHAGEIVGLLGRNGAGKSTTFKMIMGLVRPTRGSIVLDGIDVTRLPLYRRARLGLGYLAQEPTIFERLSVEDNLRAILEASHLPQRRQGARLEELLDEFGLRTVRSNPAVACSGGERRRLEIARTLITDPKIVLLDEPFAGVDPIAIEEIRQHVRNLSARGIGVLLTDHNVREVLTMTARSYIIADGQVLKEGSPSQIIVDPIVRSEYLGEKFVPDRATGYITRDALEAARRASGRMADPGLVSLDAMQASAASRADKPQASTDPKVATPKISTPKVATEEKPTRRVNDTDTSGPSQGAGT